MKQFDIVITEEYQIKVSVLADGVEEAIEFAQERYDLGDEAFIPLPDGDGHRFTGVKFEAEEVVEVNAAIYKE